MGFRLLGRRRTVLSKAPAAASESAKTFVEDSRVKALARDRFERADRMIDSLAANDEAGPLTLPIQKAAQG